MTAKSVDGNAHVADVECRARDYEQRKVQCLLLSCLAPRTLAGDVTADLIFSCPPYLNMERYSDDPADLSNMQEAVMCAALAAVLSTWRAGLPRRRLPDGRMT